jgi:ATP-dependent DNA ligase
MLMDNFEFRGFKFSVSSKWLKDICRKQAEEDVINYYRGNDKESYVEGLTDNIYETMDEETIYELAVNDGIIKDELKYFNIISQD